MCITKWIQFVDIRRALVVQRNLPMDLNYYLQRKKADSQHNKTKNKRKKFTNSHVGAAGLVVVCGQRQSAEAANMWPFCTSSWCLHASSSSPSISLKRHSHCAEITRSLNVTKMVQGWRRRSEHNCSSSATSWVQGETDWPPSSALAN